jgi:hypothetical protein
MRLFVFFFIFTPNKTVHMQLYSCPTPFPRSPRHTWDIYRRITLSFSCWYQSFSCAIGHLHRDLFYGSSPRFCFSAGNKNIAGRLIVAVWRMLQGFFSYGIIRRVNLFSDQSPFITSLWSFAYLFVWDSLKLKRLIVTSDVVSRYVCWHVGSSSGLIQHVCLFFFTTRRYLILSDLKRHPNSMPTTLIPSVLEGVHSFW